MTISFKDKVVIVTGSGGGLGRSHALQFAERGAKLVINDLGGAVDGSGGSSEAADKVVKEIKDMGGEAISNGSSVTDKEGVQKLVDDTMSAFGRIDVLVNNAGSELNKSYQDTSQDEWYKVIDTDLKGPWLMCKHFVPKMVDAGEGSVINISSLNGLVGFPLSTAYGSAKGGLVVFTKDMAIELARSGVRINCVCPGVIETEMMERWTDLMPDKDEAKNMLRGVMPINRMGSADEVAGAILFFASSDSSLCQGSILTCDGGFTAQ